MTQPPLAQRTHGADPYVWLEKRDDPEVLAYLKAENAYLDEVLQPEAALRETLSRRSRDASGRRTCHCRYRTKIISTTTEPAPVMNMRAITAALAPGTAR